MEDLGGVGGLHFAELHPIEPGDRFGDRERGETLDREGALAMGEGDGEDLVLEPLTAAVGTGFRRHETTHIAFRHFAVARLEEPRRLGREPLETFVAEKERLLEFACQAAEGSVEVGLVMFGEVGDGALVETLARLRTGPPGLHGALVEAFVRIWHDQLGIGHEFRTESMTTGAGAEVAVEGKVLRRQFRQGKAGLGIGVLKGEVVALVIVRPRRLGEGGDTVLGELLRDFERIGEAAAQVVTDDESIDDDLDNLGFRFFGDLLDLDESTVESGAQEALDPVSLEALTDGLALFDLHRSGEDEPRPLGKGDEDIDDVLDRVPHQRRPGDGIMGAPEGGVKDSEVVVDLRGRGDGRTRIRLRAALLDCDGRGESLDEIDLRFFEAVEELPRVGREGLDVASLALGIERVEGERGFPRSRDAGDDDEAVPRDLEVQVFQVVLSGTLDSNDRVVTHGESLVG